MNPWDKISKSFNTSIFNPEKTDSIASDNIVISWPPILGHIAYEFGNNKNIRILDFGCGTGSFCRKLAEQYFHIVGLDSSKEMIQIAKKSSLSNVSFVLGNHLQVSTLGKFHVITSLMTFQFIRNITDVLQTLSDSILKNGLFIFSVFNIEWVKECLNMHIPYSFINFKDSTYPTIGWKVFKGGIRIPVYNHNSKDYDNILNEIGFKKILEVYPPFTRSFVEKYSYNKPTNVSEYMILGYKKLT